MEVLPKRFRSYDLSLHPTKTVILPFGKPCVFLRKDKRNGTFDCLGFTFYWARSLKGYWIIKKKASGKRVNRFMKMLWQWARAHRHDPTWDQYLTLSSKLRGFYQYYGVRTNYKALEAVFEYAQKAWRYWLSKRSQRSNVRMADLIGKYPLPKPRIVHNI